MQRSSEVLGVQRVGILADQEIAALAAAGMIKDFAPEKVSRNAEGRRLLSFGLEPYGYSARLSWQFKVGPASLQLQKQTLDPKDPPEDVEYVHVETMGEPLIVEAHTVISGVTVERFDMPLDVQGLCIAKSSYTRLGLITQVTGIEPGFEGTLTVQLMNVSDQAIRVYPMEGVLQILFWAGSLPDTAYAGAFQGQTGVVTGSGQ